MATLVALMAVAPATAALAQQQFERPFMMYGYDGFGSWRHALVGLSMMVLFWGGLIALFFFVVRWFSGGNAPAAGHHQKAALSILEERFARGEIANEEFLERKRQLAG